MTDDPRESMEQYAKEIRSAEKSLADRTGITRREAGILLMCADDPSAEDTLLQRYVFLGHLRRGLILVLLFAVIGLMLRWWLI